MEALQLEVSGFLKCAAGRSLVVVKPNVEYTCSQGQARILDFVVMDARLVGAFQSLEQAHDNPWRPRIGIDWT
eukprot:16449549-Heterocapsa_arctica.AAC.1